MSFKAKDLHFDNSQPAFLQRLRGQMQGEDSARHERPIPRNKRLKQDDEDDAPTYVLENTNQSMTKEEYEEFIGKKDSKEDGNPEQDNVRKESNKDGSPKPKDKIAEVGANAKKRKAAKIISDEQEDDKDQLRDVKKVETKAVMKPKKKSKAVKLTFGDEEEG
ncbi:uncharacterized protein M421DRAFT_170531 [Didymella exigua CBS 183.55]|uniref:DUF4604 domain-containing protein n=1 Tax=Didymella exigua CBS 183.55 TaxID=1150837 RepID=A0A6A5RJZ1_9PLEO|nr:uncharacterized protein M421DRAFT_170531 [Didymella exigua CBS 183.55]KAF1927580.1 hypothetical protein M421DRAFT_170531 [Didymella exigua CBS 183.55]